MSEAWFHATSLPGVGAELTLGEHEARHATGARRLARGQPITLFDGEGKIAAVTIVEITRQHVRAVIDRVSFQPSPTPRIHLAAALPKGDRQSVLLSMATQLGLAALTPLHCARSVVKPSASFSSRARRIMLEACKQSRRAHLPMIRDSRSPGEVFRDVRDRDEMTVIAHPDAPPWREVMLAPGAIAAILSRGITVAIGPEGGFTDEEASAADTAGVQRVSLGDGVLRIETAAVAAIAAVMLTCPR